MIKYKLDGCPLYKWKYKKKDARFNLLDTDSKFIRYADTIDMMKDYIICRYNNLVRREDILIGDDEFMSQIKDWEHVHKIYLKRHGYLDLIETYGKPWHIGYCDIEDENEMANPMDLHVGDIVTIAVEHPKASTADVANRVGVIMSIEYIPEDDRAVYQVKDDKSDTYTYTANELYASIVTEKDACIRRLICKE